MTGHDKILAAGFRIFRLNLNNRTITECAGFGKWRRTLPPFRSQAETQRAWGELMEGPEEYRGLTHLIIDTPGSGGTPNAKR